MDRHELTRQVAYGLYRHRGPSWGTPFGDWVTAEQLLELVASAFTPAEAPVEAPVAAETPAEAPVTPAPAQAPVDPAAAALALLEAFVEGTTRAEAADRLGYASASSVGRILRGQRRMTPELIEKIQEAFGAPARKAA